MFAFFLNACTNKIICYESKYCSEKYRISILSKRSNQNNLLIILNNNGVRLRPIDSLMVQFYRYNSNLKRVTTIIIF